MPRRPVLRAHEIVFLGVSGAPADHQLTLDDLLVSVRGDRIVLRFTHAPSELTAEVEDDGRAFDPLARAAPDIEQPIEEREVGGLGIFLVKKLMTEVAYRRDGGKNILTMTKRW